MVHIRHKIAGLALFFVSITSTAQQKSSSVIYDKLLGLNQASTILYIAAHPDDENTRLISYLNNERNFRTAYLSLTRGDGGQNLIGNELKEQLGLIRTRELMEARKTDGGEQFFTRAYDFGYSKSPEETLKNWNADSILYDMVYVIRLLKPEFLITRFTSRPTPTHGHHTLSAILAEKAFDMAANPNVFKDQLTDGITPWQCKTLYFNASTFWNRDLENYAKNRDSFYMLEVGNFNALTGLSNNEIAGRSRTMHKSQGFGSAEAKGEQKEFLQFTKGIMPKKDSDPFFQNELNIADEAYLKVLQSLIDKFDFNHPENSVQSLVNLKKQLKQIKGLKPSVVSFKIQQIDELIAQCLGLHIELLAEKESYCQNENIPVTWNIYKRNQAPITFVGAQSNAAFYFLKQDVIASDIPFNKLFAEKNAIETDLFFHSKAHWLAQGKTDNLFNITPALGGHLPELQLGLYFQAQFVTFSDTIKIPVQVSHKIVDPVDGEISKGVMVLPAHEVSFSKKLMLFTNESKQELHVFVKPGKDVKEIPISGVSGNFTMKRDKPEMTLFKKDSIYHLTFSLSPEKNAQSGWFNFYLAPSSYVFQKIDYKHIGRFYHFAPAKIKLVRVDLKTNQEKIAYIPGFGDETPEYLQEAGYDVTLLKPEEITLENLKPYAVLMIGVRVYNTSEVIGEKQNVILEYISQGGHVICQYQTANGLKSKNIGPYPFTIGRGRITEENASLNPIHANSSLLNFPNKITKSDYENWVQERGLYFVSEADSNYRFLFSGSDIGEKAQTGAVIYTNYGKGSFIYTGLSFFRQLPEGVPGAYRLFANFISYKNGKE